MTYCQSDHLQQWWRSPILCSSLTSIHLSCMVMCRWIPLLSEKEKKTEDGTYFTLPWALSFSNRVHLELVDGFLSFSVNQDRSSPVVLPYVRVFFNRMQLSLNYLTFLYLQIQNPLPFKLLLTLNDRESSIGLRTFAWVYHLVYLST